MAVEIQTVTIVGQGNVASHYYNIMKEKGVNVKMVSSRLPFLKEDFKSHLIIIAVKDEAIQETVENISKQIGRKVLLNSIVVHTSGYTSTDCLKKISAIYGSFYPLQSLRRGIAIDFATVSLCIWTNDEIAMQKLENLAKKLTNICYKLNDSQRKTLHLAAVFTNNFTNHLYGIAKSILEKKNIPFSILYPLIDRTVVAVKQNNPFDIQTGPAIRKELTVMQEHKLELTEMERKIYEIISESIMNKSDIG